MSLQQAILDIADQMENESPDVKRWAAMLRITVKASESTAPLISPLVSNQLAIREAELNLARDIEKRVVKKQLTQEENIGQMTEVVGGNSDCEYVPIAGEMPVGARTKINGQVYELRTDRKLYFVE